MTRSWVLEWIDRKLSFPQDGGPAKPLENNDCESGCRLIPVYLAGRHQHALVEGVGLAESGKNRWKPLCRRHRRLPDRSGNSGKPLGNQQALDAAAGTN